MFLPIDVLEVDQMGRPVILYFSFFLSLYTSSSLSFSFSLFMSLSLCLFLSVSVSDTGNRFNGQQNKID
jgi:hypothetical protein